jgi:hypothetical protein
MAKRLLGVMKNGEPITEEVIEAIVQEAENGYTEEQLSTTRRGRGRPRLDGDKEER